MKAILINTQEIATQNLERLTLVAAGSSVLSALYLLATHLI